MSSSSQSLPTFLSIFLNTLLLIVLAIIVTLTLLFVINKLFGTDYTYKEMVSVFGAHMVPVIVVGGISLLLVLVKSNTAGSIAVSITIAFSITTIPIYLISNLLSKRPQAVDPLYGYLLYVVSAGLSFEILFTIFIDSIIVILFKYIQVFLNTVILMYIRIFILIESMCIFTKLYYKVS